MHANRETDVALIHLKLIDFGLTAVWNKGSSLKSACGTRGYLAPEVYKEDYTDKVDVFTLVLVRIYGKHV